ncbi:hypothetical protein JNUCC0626_34260 [Lentzea sp. JNUCC 0626]|uniref:hypothetical protein n=1 Tax=Lentzea sp. JNUCC 0626 TaxID=3367513 RepID=UPI003749644B
MDTLVLVAVGVPLLGLIIFFGCMFLLGRRMKRLRKEGRVQYRAKPNGTYDNSSSCASGGSG